MKNILAIMLTAVLAVGLVGCAEEDSSSSKKSSQKAENSIPVIELPEDKFD